MWPLESKVIRLPRIPECTLATAVHRFHVAVHKKGVEAVPVSFPGHLLIVLKGVGACPGSRWMTVSRIRPAVHLCPLVFLKHEQRVCRLGDERQLHGVEAAPGVGRIAGMASGNVGRVPENVTRRRVAPPDGSSVLKLEESRKWIARTARNAEVLD